MKPKFHYRFHKIMPEPDESISHHRTHFNIILSFTLCPHKWLTPPILPTKLIVLDLKATRVYPKVSGLSHNEIYAYNNKH
jgi:hypothetical protein